MRHTLQLELLGERLIAWAITRRDREAERLNDLLTRVECTRRMEACEQRQATIRAELNGG